MPVVDLDLDAPRSPAQGTLSLASACRPGTRFPSYQVLRQSDARPWQLHHKMTSDGRFRVVVFGGNIKNPSHLQRVNRLGTWLRNELLPTLPTLSLSVGADPHGATGKFVTEQDPSIVDILLVHAAPREEIELLRDLDDAYHPFDPKLGWDYDKVFVDGPSYHEGHVDAYQRYGVDADVGALVVVRPDGYVGLVTALDESGWDQVSKWFMAIIHH